MSAKPYGAEQIEAVRHLLATGRQYPEREYDERWLATLDALRERTPRDTYGCERCGFRDGLDTSLPREEWARIAAKDDCTEWSLLCLWCIDELAAERGVECEAYLYFVGRAVRSRLYDSDDDDYRWVQLYQRERARAEEMEAQLLALEPLPAASEVRA